MSKLKLSDSIKKPNLGNKKTVSIVFLAIILVVGGGVFFIHKYRSQSGEKVYAEAAGHKIYKQDIDNLIGKHKNVSIHDAATVLADKYLTEELAKEQGITVTDKMLVSEYGKGVIKQKTTFKYAYQNKLNQLFFTKLQAHANGVYKGEMLVANFSHHIKFYPTLPEDKLHDPQLGNPAAIARDKKYAQDFITRLYNEITSGRINFKQAIQAEHNDPKIGLKAYPSLSHSGLFDTSSAPNPVLSVVSIRQKINSIKAGETTKPFVVRVGVSLGDPNKTAESYFLVVKIDETSGSYTGENFSQYLEQVKTRLGYEVNV